MRGPSRNERVGALLSKLHVFLNNVCIRVTGQWTLDWGPRWQVGGRTVQCFWLPRSFAVWSGTSAWPSIWRLTPDISFTRSLDLAAMDTKLLAVNWNSRYSHLMWVQRPWQEIKQTWFELTTSSSCCLGLPLIHHQWGSLSDVGTPPTWRKVVTKNHQAWQIKGCLQLCHSSHR